MSRSNCSWFREKAWATLVKEPSVAGLQTKQIGSLYGVEESTAQGLTVIIMFLGVWHATGHQNRQPSPPIFLRKPVLLFLGE